MPERVRVCCRVRWKLKNGLKLDYHHAERVALEEDVVEDVTLLFVN
jgi:hypothetical protein